MYPNLVLVSKLWFSSVDTDCVLPRQGNDGNEAVLLSSRSRDLRDRNGSVRQQISQPSDTEDDGDSNGGQINLKNSVWIERIADSPPPLPSPPPEQKIELGIARKPLPALPPGAD